MVKSGGATNCRKSSAVGKIGWSSGGPSPTPRLAKIETAKRRLEDRQAEADRAKGRREGDGRKSPRGGRRFKPDFGVPEDKAQDNFTDPDSRIMNGPEGFVHAYNTQIAVDERTQLM